MNGMRAFFTRLPRALSLLYGAALAVILCLLVFFENHYRAYIGSNRLLNNLWLMAAAAFVLAAALLLWRFVIARQQAARALERNSRERSLSPWLLCAVYAGLFFLQCVMARSLWFYPGFDPGNVRLWSAALASGQPVGMDYYRLCPNNAPLTVLLALPCWAGLMLGLAEPYVLEVYFGALCVNLSGLTTVLCARRLTESRGLRGAVFALSTLWLLFSPYVSVPYTDSCAILFPVLTVYAMLSQRKAPVRYGLAALAASFGAAIKPSALIVLMAVVILGGCKALSRLPWKKELLRRGLVTLLAVALGYLPGRAFQAGATALLAGSAKPEEMLDTAHYLMIGTDGRYWGGHSVEGLAYSQSFATLKERNAANLSAAWRNVQGRSLRENLYFFSVKAYKAYADGAFAWNGSYLMDEVPRRTDGLSRALRSVFYYNGDGNPAFCTVAQGVWLLVLALCAAGAVARRREGPAQLLSLTLLGLTGYQLLFEVWPRYLFLYAPLFLLLAAEGWMGLTKRRFVRL